MALSPCDAAQAGACPRVLISGVSGGSGKTLVSLGLCRALVRRGLVVQPFKKGPDYIDTAWLAAASKACGRNLDPYFLSEPRLRALVRHAMALTGANIACIEGNRGLYDGKDVVGSCSTAALSRALGAPVILVLPCTKTTRTSAALLHGLATFEAIDLAGVVLNRIASPRHGDIVTRSIEAYTDIPVLGALPRLRENPLPERHMGLMGLHDHDGFAERVLEALADLLEAHANVDAFLAIAQAAPLLAGQALSSSLLTGPLPASVLSACASSQIRHQACPHDLAADVAAEQQAFCEAAEDAAPFWPAPAVLASAPCIGVVRDAALWFYYEENLEALRNAGARLVELDLFDAAPWPHLDGLYLGGGFPENVAAALADAPHLSTVRALSDAGLPIYAECGGFLLLCHSLEVNGVAYPMAGVFPMAAQCADTPQGLGYVDVRVMSETPFHPQGACFRGHEFHYSHGVALTRLGADAYVFALSTGVGMERVDGVGRDGLLRQNTFAAYTHVFAPAVPHWAPRFVTACVRVANFRAGSAS